MQYATIEPVSAPEELDSSHSTSVIIHVTLCEHPRMSAKYQNEYR